MSSFVLVSPVVVLKVDIVKGWSVVRGIVTVGVMMVTVDDVQVVPLLRVVVLLRVVGVVIILVVVVLPETNIIRYLIQCLLRTCESGFDSWPGQTKDLKCGSDC